MSSWTQTTLQAKTRASVLALFVCVANWIYRPFRPFHLFLQQPPRQYSISIPYHFPHSLYRCQQLNPSTAGRAHAWGAQHCLVAIRYSEDFTECSEFPSLGRNDQPHTSYSTFFDSSKASHLQHRLALSRYQFLESLIHHFQPQSKQTH